MKILCVGGGSGGHITPVVAVIDEIKRTRKDSKIEFITDKRFLTQARHLIGNRANITTISAGKLRRYANLRWYDHLRHIFISYIPNFIDVFKILTGIVQSWWKILRFKPDVIFIKGGYVGLPVGLAAHFMFPRLPIILHDSDATPGLTNRVLSRYASRIATGMPVKFYNYDRKKTTYVGLPVRNSITPANTKEKTEIKKRLGFEPNMPVVLAVGGGQGARAINDAIIAKSKEFDMIATTVLVSGDTHLSEVKNRINGGDINLKRMYVEGFLKGDRGADIFRSADIIITRAGATTMAEAAILAVPTIIIPSPYLAADHQSKNAAVFAESQAAIVIPEKNLESHPETLFDKVRNVLTDKSLAKRMSKNIQNFAKKDAAKIMAEIIIEVGNEKKTK